MKKKPWFAAQLLTVVAVLLCSLCQASEPDQDPSKHIPLGGATLSPQKAQVLLKQRLAEMAAATEAADEAATEEAPALTDLAEEANSTPTEAKDEAIVRAAPQAKGWFASYPLLGIHHVCSYSTNPLTGQMILETEDGTLWNVTSDCGPVFGWLTSDEIMIYPAPWYVSSPFQLYNCQTGTSVYVSMNMGPFYNGAFTRWVVAISWATGEVWLNDGSYWIVTDRSIFDSWNLNHTIIVGANDEWLSSYPSILINVNTYDPAWPKLSYVRAVLMSGPVY